MPSIVGNLACQRNSYLRRLETTVVSCVPSTSKNNSSGSGGSKENFKSIPLEKRPAADLEPFEIEFEDTVLFPEGGGQPEDHGLIKLCEGTHASQPAEILITRIARHGLRAVHFSSSPLEPGTKVVQEVSWDRRWDHMQQHTGQHLLSAVMDTYQGLETLGWSMGASISKDEDFNREHNSVSTSGPSLMPNMNFVELGRKPTDAEISEIQHRCNSIIAENRQVTVDTPSDADTTSLPSDYDASQGLVRVVKIDGIDENPCCGTHLSQTSHISLILISHTQPIRGTNTRLYFTCGQRAITLATYSIRAARSIAGIVSASISDLENVISKVTKIDLELRDAKRAKRRLEAELAKFEAENIKRSFNGVTQIMEESGMASNSSSDAKRRAFVSRVCEDSSAGMDFILSLQSELKQPLTMFPNLTYDTTGLTILVTPTTYRDVGQGGITKEDGPGPMVILGDPTLVAKAAERIRTDPILTDPPVQPATREGAKKAGNSGGGGIKGGGKGSRWQGKALKLGTAQINALRAISYSN